MKLHAFLAVENLKVIFTNELNYIKGVNEMLAVR